MELKPATIEEAESCTFHGCTVKASRAAVEAALGAPSIDYGPDAENKQRTEWDVEVDGAAVQVFDHHHYGAVGESTVLEWSVMSNAGPAQVHKGATGEYVADQQPTPTEQEIKNRIEQ